MDNKPNNSIAKITKNELLLQTDNSIRITNKLLIIREYDSIKDLFVQNPNFFNRLISKYYPLNESLINDFTNVWEFGGCLSGNQSIKWTDELISRYIQRWNWWGLGGNNSLHWSNDFINKFKDQINGKTLVEESN